MTATTPATFGPSVLAVRRALPSDEAGCLALLGDVAMETELSLSIRRKPTVEAMYALHAADWERWVVADERERVVGMGSVLVRDGYLNGAVVKVGYLGDLRFSRGAEGRHVLDRVYGSILREARERHGCEYFLSAIIATNARARRALTVPTERGIRRGRPRYSLVREFDIRSLHLVLPRWPRRHDGLATRRATHGDLTAIAALLDADARRRPFGYPMPERELRRRLASWPGLRPDSFLLAERAGSIVGVAAPWDAAPVKETVVCGYRGAMRRTRVVHDIVARLFGRPRLPDPGEAFRYRYLTHVAIPSDDPSVLQALVDAAYDDARRAGLHFLCVPAPVGDPLDAALRGYVATNLRAGLYLVTSPEVDVPQGMEAWRMPGFEMALV
jgi:hypothetical protein